MVYASCSEIEQERYQNSKYIMDHNNHNGVNTNGTGGSRNNSVEDDMGPKMPCLQKGGAEALREW